MADISSLLYTDLIWSIGGIILLAAYFSFKERLSHHALFSLGYQSFLRTFIIPLVSVFVLLSFFRFLSGVSLPSPSINGWFSYVSFIITGPFFEELFLRGLLLGGSFFLAYQLSSKYASYFFITLGFVIQLFLFVWIHGSSDLFRILYLTTIGLLYSLLFIFNKRDVLPSMVAHAFTNLIIISGAFS
jgi:membrane protease YdiL (CAAX protease family)